MGDVDVTGLVSLLVLVFGSLIGVGGYWQGKRRDAAAAGNNLLDQLQEEVKRLSSRVDNLETVNNRQADYIGELRAHIDQRLPPPPPQYPEGMRV